MSATASPVSAPEEPGTAAAAPPVERRRETRRPGEGLTGRVGFHQGLRIEDLSPSGARIVTSEWLAPGRHYHFQLAGVHLAATVERCALRGCEESGDQQRPIYEAGLRFEVISPACRQQLMAVLRTLRRPSTRVAQGGNEAP